MDNQVKVLDNVNSFKSNNKVWKFAPSFNLKQKNNEKSYPLVSESTCNRAIIHFNHSPDGRKCFFGKAF